MLRLPAFDDAVLVAGCQRPGITMLAEVIGSGFGMVVTWNTAFPELDG